MEYKILLVDNTEACKTYSEFTNNPEFQIMGNAHSTSEAKTMLQNTKYDVVITELKDKNIDGFEVVSAIHEAGNDALAVIVSERASFRSAQRALHEGVVDYLLKPFNAGTYNKMLKNVYSHITKKHLVICDTMTRSELDRLYTMFICGNINATDVIECVRFMSNGDISVKYRMMEEVIDLFWSRLVKKYKWLNMNVICGKRLSEINCELEFIDELNRVSKTIESFGLRKQDSIINNICLFMSENIDKKNIMNLVQEEFGISKSHIARQFKTKLGMTCNDFFILIKIERAKKLLKETTMKIYEISELIGYMSVDYFTEVFKRVEGITPLQYRIKV